MIWLHEANCSWRLLNQVEIKTQKCGSLQIAQFELVEKMLINKMVWRQKQNWFWGLLVDLLNCFMVVNWGQPEPGGDRADRVECGCLQNYGTCQSFLLVARKATKFCTLNFRSNCAAIKVHPKFRFLTSLEKVPKMYPIEQAAFGLEQQESRYKMRTLILVVRILGVRSLLLLICDLKTLSKNFTIQSCKSTESLVQTADSNEKLWNEVAHRAVGTCSKSGNV